jgi:sugar/nucleoside kinase (ribokinase family)
VNEDEMTLLAPEPMALAATALDNGVRCLLVTLGPRGAVYFAQPDFDGLAGLEGRGAGRPTSGAMGPVRTALVGTESVRGDVDPTGCGDVWGATCFSRLLGGAKLSDAITAAHHAAARNLTHRGATGLASYLRGELATP